MLQLEFDDIVMQGKAMWETVEGCQVGDTIEVTFIIDDEKYVGEVIVLSLDDKVMQVEGIGQLRKSCI